ncbi:MAG: 16S rRNA (uracil(1498)-N(3))-methyltransferase [Calditrichaeota bacterium]|nr:MAG: 16S rRNA (uracil(1498)-N(3))-methyltransferase [Calditrichota bacterium]
MNLILLFEEDFIAADTIRLTGRRLRHINEIHRAQTGDILTVGQLGGKIGAGEITTITKSSLEMHVELQSESPAPLPVTLVLALPRPRVLNRTLIAATSMGVKKIYLLHTNRVEKSFWHSPVLNEEKLKHSLILGLEQAKDTLLPDVYLRKRFRPFVEDELPLIAQNTRKLVAHPEISVASSDAEEIATTLIVGPEGGLIPYEIEKLSAIGFAGISLGQRILRVETAVPVLLARLFRKE